MVVYVVVKSPLDDTAMAFLSGVWLMMYSTRSVSRVHYRLAF